MRLPDARRALRIGLALLASGLGSSVVHGPANAQYVDCNRLALQISSLGRNAGSPRMQAAAQRQQEELARTAAYARSIGCSRPQFLFFSDRPPQCEGLNARIQQMQANLGQLQRAAYGDQGLKRQLTQQYAAYCANRDPSLLDRLFGREDERSYPPLEDDQQKAEEETGPRLGGPMAVCVRSCDGGYFPVSYSARRSDLAGLQQRCAALCPNTEAKVYTRSLSSDMKGAVSIDGDAYTELPNAFRYEKTFDKACTCKPADKSWSEALAEAEQLLGQNKGDIIVTREKAEELSRPREPGAPPATQKKRRFDPKAAAQLIDERRAAEAQGVSRETTGAIPDGDGPAGTAAQDGGARRRKPATQH